MRRIWISLMVAGLLPGATVAVTPGEKCEADKLKTAGKYVFCRMKAESKAIKALIAPDYSKCNEKYGDKWALIESKAGGTCPVTGDEAPIETQTTECTDGLTAAIGGSPPGDKCEADKLKTAGKYAFCRMKAESKAIKTLIAPDYSKCNEKYGARWALIESKAGGTCSVTGDAVAIETQTTDCTDGLTAAIGDNPPNQLCGNGAVDAGEDCDLGTLDGETCATQGFTGGVLSCGVGCVFDTAGCWGDDRFVDNADGTITDNATGRMWEKKTELNGATNFANPHDADNIHRWSGSCTVLTSKYCQPTAASAALCAANVEGDPTGCAECTGGEGVCNTTDTIWAVVAARNAGSFAGHSDWRVPTLQELESIVDLSDGTAPTVGVAFDGANCGAACTDITDPACSCTPSLGCWSASTYAPFSFYGRFLDFVDGTVQATDKGSSGPVRAVRGGS